MTAEALNVAFLTDSGAMFAPVVLLESLRCPALDTVVYCRSAPNRNPWSSLRKVASQSGIAYTLARSTAILQERLRGVLPKLDDVCESTPIEDANSNEFKSTLRQRNTEVLVSVFSTQILKPPTLAVPTIGCLNVHPSLLPEFAGMNPIYWALAEGRERTGFTIHVMDEQVDSGAIVVQREVEILPADSLHSVYHRVARLASGELKRCLEDIARHRQINATPQTDRPARFYRHPTRDSYLRFRQKRSMY